MALIETIVGDHLVETARALGDQIRAEADHLDVEPDAPGF
jgi:hypothetical protein